MGISNKFLALAAVVCAFAVAPIALAAGGLTVKTTPAHPKLHQKVEMRVSGLKPGEKVKAVLVLPNNGGQTATYYPKQKASSTGVFINTVKPTVKGKNVWRYTGRTSHRKGSTSYVVK
jgi:asparagine N-glycosylation enzyme membrane subunit Stt3